MALMSHWWCWIKNMKLKETMEFVYEETEETERKMYQWCKGEGKSLLREDRV